MKYSDYVKQLAHALNVPQAEVERFVKGFTENLLKTLEKQEYVDIAGFGRFKKAKRAARQGINPKDPSQKIDIPAKTVMTFKPSANVKRLVNDF